MNNKVQNVLLGVLAVGLIGITVAYAALTQQLTINGTAKVASTKWDIHFSDKKTGVAEGYAETGDFAKTSATTLGGNLGTLKAPGDKITYTFDIENAGDINAIIDNTPKKTPLINRQYLFHVMLKKNNKRLFTLLQPFNQLISQSYCSRQRWLVPMWRKPLAIFSWQ